MKPKATMRKLLSLLLILIAFDGYAQKTQLQIARNNLGKLQAGIRINQDTKQQMTILGDGIKAVESASQDRRTRKWPETWAIKAYFYSYLALIDTDEQRAEDSYTKAINLLDTVKALNRYSENAEIIDATKLNTIIKKQAKGNKAYAINDFNNAYLYLKDVSDYFPNDSTLAVNAALSAQNIRSYDNALVYFKRAKENGINNPLIFQVLANLYSSKFETEKAITTLEDGLKVNPLNGFLINDYINILVDNAQYDKAEKSIASVLNYDKDNKILYFLYGYLQQLKANNTLAEQSYRDALKLDQNYYPALYQLAITYIDAANSNLKLKSADSVPNFVAKLNQSEDLLERAHEINPNDAHTIQLLIEIYSRKKQLDKVEALKGSLHEL
jgi:tetratricopeptide (TPR) repeat protein